MKNRQWLLARRPYGPIQDSDFNFVETDVPTPGAGEVLVRTLMLSCDPTQRGWIAMDLYMPAVEIGEVVRSIGVGRIEASKNPDFAGGAEKCRWLTAEAGFDAAIDYKAEDVQARLNELCPKGVDVFFDNVGGDILDAALAGLAMRGRVVLCGAIAIYNATEQPPGPKNYLNLLLKRGRMEGFIVFDYMPRAAEAIGALAGWVQAGRIKYRVDVQHGLENAPATLRRLFDGRNEGKQLLRVAE